MAMMMEITGLLLLNRRASSSLSCCRALLAAPNRSIRTASTASSDEGGDGGGGEAGGEVGAPFHIIAHRSASSYCHRRPLHPSPPYHHLLSIPFRCHSHTFQTTAAAASLCRLHQSLIG
uniref:Secreted protein n=1 Tax=Oryza rufipogon TaxID=4529 RepID=A0A0E0NEB3_ORYRU